MTETDVIEICRSTIVTLVKVMGPVLVVMMVIGTVISVFQAVTQINEQTLSMVPKLLVTFVLALLLMPFMMGELTEFFQREVADRIVAIGVATSGSPGTGG